MARDKRDQQRNDRGDRQNDDTVEHDTLADNNADDGRDENVEHDANAATGDDRIVDNQDPANAERVDDGEPARDDQTTPNEGVHAVNPAGDQLERERLRGAQPPVDPES